MKPPQLVVLAGPNGAGKSTFYDVHLRASTLPFLNADLLAAHAGIDSLEAARLLDEARDELIEQGLGFITETVFSDPVGSKLGLLRRAVSRGHDVTLVYIGIEGTALSGLRIEQRVALGGHDVPRDKLAGRFERSLANLREAVRFVPRVDIYDNSIADAPFRLIATYEHGKRSFLTSLRIPAWARVLLKPKRKRS